MKTSIIQSLIDRNANEITRIELDIKYAKVMIKHFYHIKYEKQIPEYKAEVSKSRQTLKKLVAIQKELKKQLADNIRNENYNSYLIDIQNKLKKDLVDYEGVN